ncbi:MAG: NosD domain-containing protein, partial [Promethearchaeota archaeon]
MNKNRKKSIKAIVLIGLCLFLSFTPIMQQLIAKGVKDEKIHNNSIPHQSDMEYDGSVIHVDNNWTETVAEYDWCSGSGSWNDPFIIENIEIFVNSSIAGIFINNSQNVFFIIENCIISNNSTKPFSAGIRLENTTNGKITSVSSYQNKVGIMFINTHNTSIEESDFYSNNYGICIRQSSNDNNLYENDILDNTVQGVNITNSNDNNVYHNNFNNNTVNAVDSGINNIWNNGNQGNYWDDYVGKDRDDDGIGDTPYIISGSTGSQDDYPIWWDAPVISVISPVPYSLYGSVPPNFSVYLEEGLSHRWWYMIDSDITKNHFITNGSINALIWGLLENGSHTLFFYVNDSRGYEDYEAIIIYKDIETPSIDIIYPLNHSIFGENACNFTVIILESNLNSTWYTLNNGNLTYFDGISGQNHGVISQSEWELQYNGTVIITFFADDTVGNIGKNNVTVFKDVISPSIIINEPKSYDVFGHVPPVCNLTLYDTSSVDQVWYELTDGITTTSPREWTDIIHIDDWNAITNGTVTIIFYANDTLGNVATANVSVYKDIIGPNIFINEPHPYDLFSTVPPICDVLFEDVHGVDASWYQLTNGTFTTISQTWTGSIDINDWNSMGNGTVTIIFHANDTLGNVAMANVPVYKDIISPSIIINEPNSHDVFGHIPPVCNLTLYDTNSIDKVWYELTNGITTTSAREWTDIIHIDDWNAMTNGTVIIIFYANDTLGNVASADVLVYKDIIAPVITITEPLPYEVFGMNPPACIVSFYDINGLSETWYQLTDGITTTSVREWTDIIHIDDWNAMNSGIVTIIFFANDTLGNVATVNVSVYKDIIAPVITIISPDPYEVYGASQPQCDVLFEDIHGVDASWYQLTNGTFTTISRTWTGSIDINDWILMGNGTVTIIFYANDTLGNIAMANVSVYKDIISPSILINEPKSNDVFGQVPPDCNLTLYDTNSIDQVWYELTDGITTTNVREWTDTIHIDDWDAMTNGTVTIIFYANDTLGNVATANVSVYKDIIPPVITINSPDPYEVYGASQPECDVLFEDIHGVDASWYQLTDGTFTTNSRIWTGSIDINDWNLMGNGTVIIIFYANDTLGNVGTANVSVYKDIIAPVITITEPLPYEVFGVNPPTCIVSFDDINGISEMWYQLTDGITTTSVREWTDTIHIDDWNVMTNGTVTIIFFANDTLGNV